MINWPTEWDDAAIEHFGGRQRKGSQSCRLFLLERHDPVGDTNRNHCVARKICAGYPRENNAGRLGWSSAAKLLPVGSVVVTTRASLGMAAIAAVPLTTNQGFKSIIPNESTDSLFTYYCIQSLKSEMVRLASGTTFLEISKSDFSRIRTRRPKRPEQSRISAVLDTVDEAIAKTEAVIAKLRQVRAGLLHDIACGLDKSIAYDATAHPDQFQESSLGRIPKDWNCKALGDAAAGR